MLVEVEERLEFVERDVEVLRVAPGVGMPVGRAVFGDCERALSGEAVPVGRAINELYVEQSAINYLSGEKVA